MKTFGPLILLSTVLILTACTVEKKNATTEEDSPNPSVNTLNWTPNDVKYTCEDENFCPDNQGLLFFVQKTTERIGSMYEHRLMVYRCTGTLYDSNKVITAGHCADKFSSSDSVYFVTVRKPGHPSQIRTVQRSLGSHIIDKTQPDYGALELKESVTGIQFAHPAQEVPQSIDNVLALVSNPVKDSKTDFVLNAISCQNQKYPYIPLTKKLDPSVFYLKNCKLFSGNSGGIVVQTQDLMSVLGIVDTSSNAEDSHASNRMKNTLADFGTATNARCFRLPSWPQVSSSCIETTEKKLNSIELALRGKSIIDYLKQETANWFISQASLDISDSRVHFIPEIVHYIDKSIATSSNEGETLILPTPICFEHIPPPTGRVEITPQKLNMISRPLELPQYNMVPTQFKVEIQFLQQSSQFRYKIGHRVSGYDGAHIFLLFDGDPMKNLTRTMNGVDRSIPPCTGNEKQSFLDGVNKALDDQISNIPDMDIVNQIP